MRKLRPQKSCSPAVITGAAYLAKNTRYGRPARCVLCHGVLTPLACAAINFNRANCPHCGSDPLHERVLARRAHEGALEHLCTPTGKWRVRGGKLQAEVYVNSRDRRCWINCGAADCADRN